MIKITNTIPDYDRLSDTKLINRNSNIPNDAAIPTGWVTEQLIQPPNNIMAYATPSQHYEEGTGWVLDEPIDQGIIEHETIFSKLEIRRAMRTLNIEDKLNTILTNATFKADWADAIEIDMSDEMFLAGFDAGTVTIDELNDIKREIINNIRK